jgi:hypothetical protein
MLSKILIYEKAHFGNAQIILANGSVWLLGCRGGEKTAMAQRTDNAVAVSMGSVRGERNLLADVTIPGIDGARAALETFYYAFNTRSVDLLRQIWADDPLAQVETPLVGLIRGYSNISAVYDRMGGNQVQIKTVLDDVVAYISPGLSVFTERERATSTKTGEHGAITEELSGRSICVFQYRAEVGWRLIYHKITLDH